MFISFYACHSFAQQEANSAFPEKKVYVVNTMGGYKSAVYVIEGLEKAEYFNGIKCLKGQYIDSAWLKSKTVYIPVDKVTSIIEFNSLAEYKTEVLKNRNLKKRGGEK